MFKSKGSYIDQIPQHKGLKSNCEKSFLKHYSN